MSDSKVNVEIGNLIRKKRKERGLQRSILANRLKINVSTLNGLENGYYYPSNSIIHKLNEYFKTDEFVSITFKCKNSFCDEMFLPKNKNRLYCSLKCRQLASRYREKMKKLHE